MDALGFVSEVVDCRHATIGQRDGGADLTAQIRRSGFGPGASTVFGDYPVVRQILGGPVLVRPD